MKQIAQDAKKQPSLQQRMSLMKGWEAEVLIEAPQQTVWSRRLILKPIQNGIL